MFKLLSLNNFLIITMLKQVIVATKNERITTEADAKESSCQKEQVRIVSSRLYIYI